MFLFPWLDWGIDISDCEKIDFLGHGRFWGVPSPWAGWFFAAATLTPLGRKLIFQKVWYTKKFWKIFRKTSQLSRNIFWACWDHIVAQKSLASKKSAKNYRIQGPPCLPNCVICCGYARWFNVRVIGCISDKIHFSTLNRAFWTTKWVHINPIYFLSITNMYADTLRCLTHFLDYLNWF